MYIKPTIYLHIGAGKTGSTSIQIWLKNSEVELAEAGYIIFDTDFKPTAQHVKISNQQDYFHNVLMHGSEGIESFQHQFRQNLSYMAENGFHSAIISAENLINPWINAHTWFLPFIDECNWKIIAYVRNQPNYIISAWKEWGYWINNFDDVLDGTIRTQANWLNSLKPWDDAFGQKNIYLGVLDKSCLVDGLLHHDFAAAINLTSIVAHDQNLVHANKSINNQTALLFAKIRHKYLARHPELQAIVSKQKMTNREYTIQQRFINNSKLKRMFHKKKLVVSYAPFAGTLESGSSLSLVNQNILDQIHATYADSNHELLARYRPDIDIEQAFPRVIHDSDVKISDEDLIFHGFHLFFEMSESFQTQLKNFQTPLKNLAARSTIQQKHVRELNNVIMEQQKSIKYLQSQHDIVQTQLSQAQQQFSKVQQQIDELQNQLIVRNAYNHDMNARLNTIKYWGLRLWNRLRNRS